MIPDGWWAETVLPGGEARVWRLDGLLVAKSFLPSATDPQAGQDYVLGFRVQAPRIMRRVAAPAFVESDSIEEVCGRADAVWPSPFPDGAPAPKAGMAVWHERAVYTIASAVLTPFAVHPIFANRAVYRVCFLPLANDRGGARPFSTEIPVSEWPRTYLIIDPA